MLQNDIVAGSKSKYLLTQWRETVNDQYVYPLKHRGQYIYETNNDIGYITRNGRSKNVSLFLMHYLNKDAQKNLTKNYRKLWQ